MSYAKARLDLSSVQVACLQGPNGAGKSALLDAATWALWECARSSSDELIRLGQQEMWVDLSFAHEGQTYRVRRARYKSPTKSGGKTLSKGTLELQIFCPGDVQTSSGETRTLQKVGSVQTLAPAIGPSALDSNVAVQTRESPSFEHKDDLPPNGDDDNEKTGRLPGTWKSLTGSNMRETQRQITALLRMDYDTFINSAYIRQGKADEFTTRMPSERKQVLAEILGLSYFDRLQERCKQKVRDLRFRIEALEATVLQLPESEKELCETQDHLSAVKIEFTQVARETDEAQAKSEEFTSRLQNLLLKRQSFESGNLKCAELKDDISNYAQQEKEIESRLNALLELIDHSKEIEAAAKRFEALKKQVEVLDQQAFEQQELTAQRLELQSELANLRSRLEVELEHCRLNLKDLEAKQTKLRDDTEDSDKVYASYKLYKDLVTEEAHQAKRQETYIQLSDRAAQLESKITEARIKLEAELSQKQSSLDDLISLLKNAQATESQKSQLEEKTDLLDKYEAEFELVEQKGIAVKHDLEAAERNIEDLRRRQRENLDKIHELTAHVDSTVCPLCSAPIVDRLAVIERYRQLNSGMDNEIAHVEEIVARLENERNTLRKEYLSLRQRLNERKALDNQIGEFNEKIKAVVRARENEQRLSQECKTLKVLLEEHDYALVERESLISVKAEIHKGEFDPFVYSNLQGQLRAQRHIEGKFQQLQRDSLELKKIEDDLPKWREKITRFTDELSAESYGLEVRQKLHIVQERISKLTYDGSVHFNLRQELGGLMWSAERSKEVQKALLEKPMLEESFSNAKRMHNSKTEQLALLESDLNTWRNEIDLLPDLSKEAEIFESAVGVLRQRKEEVAKRLAVLEAQETRLRSDMEQLDKKRLELDKIRMELDDYSFLSEALGKKGIQAIIIENAVPEIENEANRILSRLADNKMHVALVTQYQSKTGNVVETLDLIIGDDVGSRNYELYSGGEAFKVNFAIRVALARLLARRSGAKLETLIIDEGFGSQDEVSRDRLVHSIRSIQSDFARVLVITHMNDIKEMFPVQIRVSKRNGLSQLELIS
jgi:exonuclease SbcC